MVTMTEEKIFDFGHRMLRQSNVSPSRKYFREIIIIHIHKKIIKPPHKTLQLFTEKYQVFELSSHKSMIIIVNLSACVTGLDMSFYALRYVDNETTTLDRVSDFLYYVNSS